MINLIDLIFILAVIICFVNGKVERVKKQPVLTDKYYKYRVWLTLLEKHKKNQ